MIEKVPTDSKDRPMIDITIFSTEILNNPFDSLDESKLSEDASKLLNFWKTQSNKKEVPSVGKYLKR